jgi:hypothetical protein
MTDLVVRPILAVGMAPRATTGNENLQVLRFSPNLGKAGRGACADQGIRPTLAWFSTVQPALSWLSEGVSDAD